MRLFSTLPGELISIFRGFGDSADTLNAKAYLIGAYPRSIIFKEDCSDLEIVLTGDLEKTVEHFVHSYKMIKDKKIRTENGYIYIPNPYSDGDFIRVGKTKKDFKGGAGDIKSEIFSRGFSIDALTVSLNVNTFGSIVDYAGALDDTQNKVLKILKRTLFFEEPKYIFKAFAYKARYGLSIDPITDTLLKRAIREKTYAILPKQEVKLGFEKIKKEKNGKQELKVLKSLIEG